MSEDARSTGTTSQPQNGSLTSEQRVEFIHREIDRHLELVKHNDVVGPAAPFVGFSAALLPVVVLLPDTLDDTRRFYIACAPLCAFLATVATFLAHRFMRATANNYFNLLHVDWLRGYFAGRSSDLADYVPRAVSRGFIASQLNRYFNHTIPGILVFPCLVAASGLLGVTSALLAWWWREDGTPWQLSSIGAVAALVAIAGEMALTRWMRRQIARHVGARFGVLVPTGAASTGS